MRERVRLPQDLRLRGRDVTERIARLRFEGRRRDRETGRIVVSDGIITLVREDGMWRIRHEQWQDRGFDLPAEPNKHQPPDAK